MSKDCYTALGICKGGKCRCYGCPIECDLCPEYGCEKYPIEGGNSSE